MEAIEVVAVKDCEMMGRFEPTLTVDVIFEVFDVEVLVVVGFLVVNTLLDVEEAVSFELKMLENSYFQ